MPADEPGPDAFLETDADVRRRSSGTPAWLTPSPWSPSGWSCPETPTVRLNEFPSRAAFSALTGDSDWASGRHHREAGIDQTYALITAPVVYDPSFGAGADGG